MFNDGNKVGGREVHNVGINHGGDENFNNIRDGGDNNKRPK